MSAASPPLRVGTRASQLARAQSDLVAGSLRQALGREVELVPVRTEGDVSTASLASIGGTGVFVTALRAALLEGRVDVAVHSLKDLPTEPPEGIALAAVPAREDPRDVLVARDGLTLAELPPGSRVGTGSPRRVAQLAALGLGLDLVDVRGNVDTRIGKVRAGELDGVVLARAGLLRLGRADEATETLDPIQVLPAAGQGALAVECRADDPVADEVRRAVDHAPTRACVTAERVLLARLEAGCAAPVGALADVAEDETGEQLWLRAVALAVDGGRAVRRSATGPVSEATALGETVAAELLAEGAADLVHPAHAEGLAASSAEAGPEQHEQPAPQRTATRRQP
ncbi:MAG: hydroxymethylbilane synthase [Marmoricola sp.]